MKFLTEEASILDSEIVESINESTGQTQKNYFIKGVFSTPGQKNRNGRIYPVNLWEREVEKYQHEIQNNSINSLGEWEHPARTQVDPINAVMKMVEVKMDNGLVYGKAKILNNNSEKTNQLKALIDENMKIGVSSRSVGTVKNGLVENFSLITWDAVAFPSDYNSNLDGINESLNESMGEISFILDDNGNIIQNNNILNEDFYNQDEINNAIIEKFDSILKGINSK